MALLLRYIRKYMNNIIEDLASAPLVLNMFTNMYNNFCLCPSSVFSATHRRTALSCTVVAVCYLSLQSLVESLDHMPLRQIGNNAQKVEPTHLLRRARPVTRKCWTLIITFLSLLGLLHAVASFAGWSPC